MLYGQLLARSRRQRHPVVMQPKKNIHELYGSTVHGKLSESFDRRSCCSLFQDFTRRFSYRTVDIYSPRGPFLQRSFKVKVLDRARQTCQILQVMSNTKEVDLVREFTLRLAPKLPPKEPQDINDDVWALCGHPTSIGGTCRNAIRRKVRLEQVKLCHIHAKPSIRMQYFFFELSLEVSYNILGHLDPVSRVALALCNKDSLAIVQGGEPVHSS